MVIGERLRALRAERNLSQGDIEERTGLKRCYVSRVENGHTVPAVDNLERMARAIGVPMYRLFYEGTKPPKPLHLPQSRDGESEWGSSGKDAKLLRQFRRVLARTTARNQKLLFHVATKMAGANRGKE